MIITAESIAKATSKMVISGGRRYRPWLVKGLSRDALYELSAPATAPGREAIERKLWSAEKVPAPEIRQARRSTTPQQADM